MIRWRWTTCRRNCANKVKLKTLYGLQNWWNSDLLSLATLWSVKESILTTTSFRLTQLWAFWSLRYRRVHVQCLVIVFRSPFREVAKNLVLRKLRIRKSCRQMSRRKKSQKNHSRYAPKSLPHPMEHCAGSSKCKFKAIKSSMIKPVAWVYHRQINEIFWVTASLSTQTSKFALLVRINHYYQFTE